MGHFKRLAESFKYAILWLLADSQIHEERVKQTINALIIIFISVHFKNLLGSSPPWSSRVTLRAYITLHRSAEERNGRRDAAGDASLPPSLVPSFLPSFGGSSRIGVYRLDLTPAQAFPPASSPLKNRLPQHVQKG